MRARRKRKEESGISPVVGSILLVAIVIVLGQRLRRTSAGLLLP
jgi:flagellin-like protein